MIISKNNTLLEGEQVEAYKKRKTEERNKKFDDFEDRYHRRYNSERSVKSSDKAEKTYQKDMNRREKEYDSLIDKDEEIKKQHPGEKPKGFFKGKQKKEYDEKLKNYKEKKDKSSEDIFNKSQEISHFDRDRKIIKDTIDRHERRHPKKESTIFDDVVFDEFTILEGQQAEAYKKRKAEEKVAKEKAEKERTDKRYSKKDINDLKNLDSVGSDPVYHRVGHKTDRDKSLFNILNNEKSAKKFEQDGIRGRKSAEIVQKELRKRVKDMDDAFDKNDEKEATVKLNNARNIAKDGGNVAFDATNRHIRRHSKTESVFENIEMI